MTMVLRGRPDGGMGIVICILNQYHAEYRNFNYSFTIGNTSLYLLLLHMSVLFCVYKPYQCDEGCIIIIYVMYLRVETHVSRHLRGLLEDNGMNDPFQSAYRPYHSTETATVKIFSDICLSLSRSRDVVLCLLDLRSAFDT